MDYFRSVTEPSTAVSVPNSVRFDYNVNDKIQNDFYLLEEIFSEKYLDVNCEVQVCESDRATDHEVQRKQIKDLCKKNY